MTKIELEKQIAELQEKYKELRQIAIEESLKLEVYKEFVELRDLKYDLKKDCEDVLGGITKDEKQNFYAGKLVLDELNDEIVQGVF